MEMTKITSSLQSIPQAAQPSGVLAARIGFQAQAEMILFTAVRTMIPSMASKATINSMVAQATMLSMAAQVMIPISTDWTVGMILFSITTAIIGLNLANVLKTRICM